MRDRAFKYSALNVDLVTMEPGEEFLFEQAAASASMGVFYLSGSTTMVDGAVPARVFDTVGGWLPNAAQGWSNDTVGHADMLLRASPTGAEWMCLSVNETGAREIQHVAANGDVEIPVGWGFVVARGSVSIGVREAGQAAYAKPRDEVHTVTGVADLLLVKG